MKNKLLNKTLKIYLIISAISFLIGIPVFYYTIQRLWLEDIDDSLRYQKEELLNNGIDSNLNIVATDSLVATSDSIYFYSRFDSLRNHVEPFRELRSYGIVEGIPSKILIRRDLVESEDLLTGIMCVSLLIFALLLTFIFVIFLYYSKRIWRPFYLIMKRLGKLEVNRSKLLDVPCQGTFEFEVLIKTINSLISHNHKLFLAQKEFSENAAHEIQTPLAAIRSELNLLYSLDFSAQQAEHLSRIEKQLRIASSICQNLLLLTKINNNQYNLDNKVSVTKIIRNFYESIEEELPIINKKVILHLEEVDLQHSNDTLLIILFNNLLNNAIKYSLEGTSIIVSLTSTYCSISNEGPEKPLNEANIYSRFYRNESAVSGTGLGLSIAKEITKIMKMDLLYHFNSPTQHVFTIKFIS